MSNDFDEIIQTIKSQHFAKGSIELLPKEELDQHICGKFLTTPNGPKEVIARKGDVLILLAKISPFLFLELKSFQRTYGVSILKGLAHQIDLEIRNSVTKTNSLNEECP